MPDQIRECCDGLTVKVYRGDGAALLAFDVAPHLLERLAGFAVRCTDPTGARYWLKNRLTFAPVTARTPRAASRWTDTIRAPLQKFRWTHFPGTLAPGRFTYEVIAMQFRSPDSTRLERGPSATLAVELAEDNFSRFELGFTRGYLSSQAYHDRFGNAPVRPPKKSLDFDAAPFEARYRWLGGKARRLLFDFLEDCIRDASCRVDAFVYDLDEPDVVRALERLGPRLRVFMDDSDRHVEAGALEVEARRRLEASAGPDNVRGGHFGRFAHSKVLVKTRDGRAERVLTGSANLTIRGLYVQANNVLVFDDPAVADLYERAFTQAFTGARTFRSSDIAARWFDVGARGIPSGRASFAPHSAAAISLDAVASEIAGAGSSVLFAVMELGGGGPVLESLRTLPADKHVFSAGITQRVDGSLLVKSPRERRGSLVPFAYLSRQVPPPFNREWSGGRGQAIHHKFVVVDFNDTEPAVFTGSSNLSSGGEERNGDNLLAIRDPSIVTAFAVEAIRLYDHYRFRAALRRATAAAPLRLQGQTARWWQGYYRATNLRYIERTLLVS